MTETTCPDCDADSIRRLQELAWEEGFQAGVHDEWEYQHLDAPSAPTLNPYREETAR